MQVSPTSIVTNSLPWNVIDNSLQKGILRSSVQPTYFIDAETKTKREDVETRSWSQVKASIDIRTQKSWLLYESSLHSTEPPQDEYFCMWGLWGGR